MYTLWNSRPDLKNVFPDIFGKDRIAYCHWFIDSANREYSFTEEYINPVVASLSQITTKFDSANRTDEKYNL